MAFCRLVPHFLVEVPCSPWIARGGSLSLYCIFNAQRIGKTYLGKIPWDAVELFFGPFDHTLQPTVGECVALVELQVPLVCKEATASFW